MWCRSTTCKRPTRWPRACWKTARRTFFEKRYRQIRSYEEYLYENSYRVVKIFLHVSKDEQKKRFFRAH
ncbi:MAG: hypothetical protein ACLUW8_15585 [Subdoligranulum sp.]